MNAGIYEASFPSGPQGYQPSFRQSTPARGVTSLQAMRARGRFHMNGRYRVRGLGQPNEFAGPSDAIEQQLPEGQGLPMARRCKCSVNPFWLLTGIGGLISIPILVFSKTRG